MGIWHMTEAEITALRERLGPQAWFEAQRAALGHGDAICMFDGKIIKRGGR